MDEEKMLELIDAFEEDPEDEDARRELVEGIRNTNFDKMRQFRNRLATLIETFGNTDEFEESDEA